MVFSPKDRVTVSAPNGLSLGVPTTLLAAAGGSVALSVAQLVLQKTSHPIDHLPKVRPQ